MSTILQVQQESLQKCSENAFHSLISSESGASHEEQHGDDFVEFCHALYSWAADH
jgi:hypothetical protein